MNSIKPIQGQLQRRQLIAASGLAAGALVLPPVMKSAIAQTAPWPNKPIRIIVAFAAGGLTDAYARLYAEQLTAKVENVRSTVNELAVLGNTNLTGNVTVNIQPGKPITVDAATGFVYD